MTVQELYYVLRDLCVSGHAHDPIFLSYNYGDYHSTQAVGEIASIEELPLIESAYSYSGWAISEDDGSKDDEIEDDEDDQPTAFILRSV